MQVVFVEPTCSDSAPDNYFSNQYRTGKISGQSVTVKTRIHESISMLMTFLVIFLGLGASGVGMAVRCGLNNLLKVCL